MISNRIAKNGHSSWCHRAGDGSENATLFVGSEVVEHVEQNDASGKSRFVTDVAGTEPQPLPGTNHALGHIDLPSVVVDTLDRNGHSMLAEEKRQHAGAASEIENRSAYLPKIFQGGSIHWICPNLGTNVGAQKVCRISCRYPRSDSVVTHGERCSIRSINSGKLNGFGRIAETPICKTA